MTELKDLKKEADILNAEGCILGLYTTPNNKFYLGSLLKDGSGTVFYAVKPNRLKDYLQSQLTIVDLYNLSDSFLVRHKFRKEVKTYLKEDFSDSLKYGTAYYKDISD